ncbi:MAG TPA: glycosyltransferase family 4 protein [Candidatus Binatia bacterium]|nr:glycosyltransferase family 4 protein [Candidatus Binatia bacterium]
MHLLLLTEYFPSGAISGGVESRAFHLLRELAKKHRITVLCSYQGKSQHRLEHHAGITILRVGFKSPYSSTGNILTRLSYAGAALLTGLFIPKVNVVEGFSYLTYPVASLIALFRHKPAVATYHESWTFREWVKLKGWLTGTLGAIWTTLALLLPFKRYIAVSNVTKQQLVKRGIPARKIDVVYNGVDLALMRSISVRPYREPSVSTTVRLIKSKRVDTLIRATAELRKKLPNVKVTVQGVGEEQERLEKLVAKLKLNRNVEFRGRMGKFEDMLKLRKRHRVFCLPSEIEGFGMVVIEAMALGIPVVCTDIPVLREVTGNGKGSLLFAKRSHKDLAHKLHQLLTDQALYAKKQKEALAHAKAFDWVKLAKQAEQTYRKVR